MEAGTGQKAAGVLAKGGGILVAYASRCGSTVGVARAVRDVLRERHFEVDIAELADVVALESYDAAVIGAPVRVGRWVGEAREFLMANRGPLGGMPVACFATGISLAKDSPARRRLAREWIRGVAKIIEPVATASFAGALDRSKLPLFARILTRLVGAPQGDFRDWEAIRAWASGLPEVLAGASAADGD